MDDGAAGCREAVRSVRGCIRSPRHRLLHFFDCFWEWRRLGTSRNSRVHFCSGLLFHSEGKEWASLTIEIDLSRRRLRPRARRTTRRASRVQAVIETAHSYAVTAAAAVTTMPLATTTSRPRACASPGSRARSPANGLAQRAKRGPGRRRTGSRPRRPSKLPSTAWATSRRKACALSPPKRVARGPANPSAVSAGRRRCGGRRPVRSAGRTRGQAGSTSEPRRSGPGNPSG